MLLPPSGSLAGRGPEYTRAEDTPEESGRLPVKGGRVLGSQGLPRRRLHLSPAVAPQHPGCDCSSYLNFSSPRRPPPAPPPPPFWPSCDPASSPSPRGKDRPSPTLPLPGLPPQEENSRAARKLAFERAPTRLQRCSKPSWGLVPDLRYHMGLQWPGVGG